MRKLKLFLAESVTKIIESKTLENILESKIVNYIFYTKLIIHSDLVDSIRKRCPLCGSKHNYKRKKSLKISSRILAITHSAYCDVCEKELHYGNVGLFLIQKHKDYSLPNSF